MKLKLKEKIKNTFYILFAREQVINKSNKVVYCVKEESKFSKGISGKVISSTVPIFPIFQPKQHRNEVFT